MQKTPQVLQRMVENISGIFSLSPVPEDEGGLLNILWINSLSFVIPLRVGCVYGPLLFSPGASWLDFYDLWTTILNKKKTNYEQISNI